MAKGNVIGVAVLGLVIVSGAAPIGVTAQQRNDRPRRAANSADAGYQVAFDQGYRKGFDKGAEDANDNRSRPLGDFKEYRSADAGYQEGFSKGYKDAVSRQQYGARPGQSPVLVPGRDANGKPVLGRGSIRGRGPADAGPPGINRQGRGVDPYGGPVILNRGGNGNGNGRNANRGYGYPGGQSGSYPGGYPGGYPSGYPGGYPSGYPTANAGAYPGGYGGGYPGGGYGANRIGFSASMVVELETPVSTKFSREGDRFSARVVDPGELAGSRVEGYIGRIDKAGRVAGKAEIVLVFEGIIFPDGYAERMPAQVEEVLGYGYSYGGYGGRNGRNKRDDVNATAGDEGQIVGEGSKGRDTAIIGGSAGVGAAVGAVLGGTKGAVIGAAIGAVTGGTVVATNRGRDIELQPGAQLRIRTGQGVRP